MSCENVNCSTMLRRVALAALMVASVCLWAASGAAASAPGAAPGWTIDSVSFPTNFTPGTTGTDRYVVTATNVGAASSNGSAITLTDTLPAGLTPTSGATATDSAGNTIACAVAGQVVTCTDPDTTAIAAGGTLVAEVPVEVAADAPPSVTNEAAVTGGAATGASDSQATTVSATPAAFSSHSFHLAISNANGTPDTQAGSHPYAMTTSFAVSTELDESGKLVPVADPKGIRIELPAGLSGNPLATPRCLEGQLIAKTCLPATQVGTITLYVVGPGNSPYYDRNCPVYNLVPPEGTPARFAFDCVANHNIYLDASVRTGSDYGVTMTAEGIPQQNLLMAQSMTLWGVPAYANGGSVSARPLLTLPSACEGPKTITAGVDSWGSSGVFGGETIEASSSPLGFTGCEKLGFDPALSLSPEMSAAASPSGVHVDLKVPQNEAPNGLAEADLKDATVTLPVGMSVNPSAAAGLVGCPLEGAEGVNLHSPEAAGCPEASKIGTVHIKTPLLEEELSGGVYVAQQGNLPGLGSNPFGSLLAIYVVAEGSAGVRIKLAGNVETEPITGQVITTFDENPQLPFEDLELDFFGGERAVLSTPSCGTYAASAALTPYSSAEAVKVESQSFTISSGCGGGFAPSLAAGTANPQAGAYSPFTMTLRHKDGEQSLSTVSLTLPEGMAGMISKVSQCGEAQANTGACPAASQIGHVTVQAGVGNEPITLPQAGKPQDPVYLTGPYEGAPFGLSIVVPAEAGPFDLGTVLVRAKIEVNPQTAQVSVKSNPMPTILQGIPLDVKAINVTIDREGFMFNPTSCEPASLAGTIGSAEGASAAVSRPFQAADCAVLPFKPSFSAGVDAHHTKADGDELHVAISSGSGQANIAKVHVTLPEKLPSRLETLKLACSAAQFAQNPSACPAASIVGTATVHTPVLPVAMTGPAMFVSHGGAGFPNLDLVLQGDGVRIVLVGNTLIENGITSSTFASVPDLPVSNVELTLPAGPYSALAANGDLCAAPLYMPTTITGQNGAVFDQRTRIAVSGCKPEIRVIAKKAGRARATLSVSVPGGGTLTATGNGIAKAVTRAHGAGTVKLTLKLSRATRKLLAKHPGRRLKVSVKLRFTPASGKPISARGTVLIG